MTNTRKARRHPKIAVYTCFTDGYDTLKVPKVDNPWIDFICFADLTAEQIKEVPKPWKVRPTWDIPEEGLPTIYDWDEKDWKVKTARFHKICPHIVLPEYDITIWIDANMEVVGEFDYYLRNDSTSITSKPWDMMLINHPERQCVYDEFAAVKALRKDTNIERLEKMEMDLYHMHRFPRKATGMWSTGLMIRKNNRNVNQVMNKWWDLVAKYSYRDQLSIPFVLLRGDTPNIRIFYLFWKDMMYLVNIIPHNRRKAQHNDPFIFPAIPWDWEKGRKDLGKAYNYFVKSIQPPDHTDPWILFLDYDFMFLNFHWYEDLQQAIFKQPEAGLITVWTSRGANELQVYQKNEEQKYGSEVPDILYHRGIANRLAKTGEVHLTDITAIASKKGISGFAMLFKKSTWEACGGFTEKADENGVANFLGVDNDFTFKVIDKAHKTVHRVDTIYSFHYYRLEEGQKTNHHLL